MPRAYADARDAKKRRASAAVGGAGGKAIKKAIYGGARLC